MRILTYLVDSNQDQDVTFRKIVTADERLVRPGAETVTLALWQLYWQEGVDISDLDALPHKLSSKLDVSEARAKEWIESSTSNTIKEKLKLASDEAINLGAFGAPTMVVQRHGSAIRELFFGSDRFDHIAMHLGVKYYGPIPVKSKI